MSLMLTKVAFIWSIYSKYNAAQLFAAWITIRNVSWAVNHNIRMISVGSYETEDWINDVENSALHHRNKLHFRIYYKRKQLF